MSTVIVYVHGLWLKGAESVFLRRRLARDLKGEARTFAYRSVAADVSTNARALAEYLAAIRADTLHLVGHSLGGLVIFKLFEDAEARVQVPQLQARVGLPPGRIVLLGSPLRGCRAAQNFSRLPLAKQIMGMGVGEELLVRRERRWNQARPLGIIAGDLGIGLGRLAGTLGGPSDGTILVEETRLDGAADRVVLRASHTGLLFSGAVARAAGAFLRTGRF
jgi:pimeloyl-ACP methyl ester carboxylesterase